MKIRFFLEYTSSKQKHFNILASTLNTRLGVCHQSESKQARLDVQGDMSDIMVVPEQQCYRK